MKCCDEVTIIKELVYFNLCFLNSYCNDLSVDVCNVVGYSVIFLYYLLCSYISIELVVSEC